MPDQKTILYVDTSLSSRWIYKSSDGGPPDPEHQPYLIRIVWILDDGITDPPKESCHIIEVPAAIRMAPEASQETHIFDHTLYDRRTSLKGAMTEFCEDLGLATWVVAYNIRHHLAVLDHALSYRLGWPLRPWPNTGCAQHAARELADREEDKLAAAHNMTLPTRRKGQYLKFENAAKELVSWDITPRYSPTSDGYRRVIAVREIWRKYLELKDVEQSQGE